ncbi:formate transporter FocA [Paraferrimonas sp. SM1919]|uniref:formate transporter FocA n=1 Tax=Paraferrimonas sp. SM1919 TaxID=2662263 RepID=UPI0013D858E8|nr:formate transporter FocA [Paraferrimonas sp. SM1919]
MDQKQPHLSLPESLALTAENNAVKKTKRDPLSAFILAISAGIFIGLAFVFYTTVTTGMTGQPWGSVKLQGGLAFSLGLIILVVCGGELFTSSVLATLARASNKVTTKEVANNWLTVYLGNAVGALFLVAIIWYAQMHMAAGGQWGLNALNIATHKLHHSFGQAVVLGFLCNLMVCLAIWMTFSTQDPIKKALLVMLPVALFVSSGFEHCIANLFMVPLGVTIHEFAGPEFWTAIGKSAAAYSELTMANFITSNLIPVTIGNILGGAFLGLGYWAVYRRPEMK